jgi:hypothetical protein
MFSFIAKAATLALAVSPAFGKIYTTNPVATTTGTGGQVLTVQWGKFLFRLTDARTLTKQRMMERPQLSLISDPVPSISTLDPSTLRSHYRTSLLPLMSPRPLRS